MEANIYQTPEADLGVAEETEAEFYVVSMVKFYVRYLVTMGIYGIYWFYKHWRQHKDHSGRGLWPVPRAIFSIFFAHSLFGLIYRKAQSRDSDLRWSPGWFATIYVVVAVLGNLSDTFSSFGASDAVVIIVSFGSMFVVAWVLSQA